MNSFEVNGRNFKLNKINAFKQFHIVRRIAPILTELLPVIGEIKKLNRPDSNLSESEKFEEIAKFGAPLITGFSKLSDEDSDKVLYGLLSAVEIQQSAGNWARVANDSMLMIQDLELPLLLQLAGRAFLFNLSGFFDGLPRKE